MVKKQNQYKDFLSDFKIWNQNHTKDWLIFQKLRQTFIDRRNGSFNGELYTILTNKAQRKERNNSS
jgi:hypothetical protein